ncbi:metal-dependent hydrolase [Peptococcus simiae]|uniref:metal-dependent hydrolase n=1 Tax=Peptococcus simiae TaxID=1643805 RepID=UPI00397F3F27
MQGRTHLVGGLAVGLAMLSLERFQMPMEDALVCLGMTAVGSLIPDIDTPESKLGHLVKPLALVLNRTIGHRGLTHSPLFIAILYLLLEAIIPRFHDPALFFAVGMLSHLVLDMLNHKGVPLLYPLPLKLHIANLRNSSIEEFTIRMILYGTCFLLCLHLVMEKGLPYELL